MIRLRAKPLATPPTTAQCVAQNGQHTVAGFAAGRGYDLVSGVGTVYAPDFVPALAALAKG